MVYAGECIPHSRVLPARTGALHHQLGLDEVEGRGEEAGHAAGDGSSSELLLQAAKSGKGRWWSRPRAKDQSTQGGDVGGVGTDVRWQREECVEAFEGGIE